MPEHQLLDLFQGNGVFETILVTENANPVLWHRHTMRLEKGAKFLGTKLTIDFDELRNVLIKHIQQQNQAASLRLNLIFLPHTKDLIIRFFPFQWPKSPARLYVNNQYYRGNSPHYQYKTLSRIENSYFHKIAQDNKCDDYLILDNHANILETCLANIFFVRYDGKVETPIAKDNPLLNGVLRQYLLDSQKEFNITCIEKNISLNDIANYTQAFITNGLRLIQPVSHIANWQFSQTDFAWSLRDLVLSANMHPSMRNHQSTLC
jgi:branched-subunit amino acid aminotransferase/4-amino-4-deoxychorismate lyase